MHFRKVLKQALSVILCSTMILTTVPEMTLYAKADNEQVTVSEDNCEEEVLASESTESDIFVIDEDVVEQTVSESIDAVAPSINTYATKDDLINPDNFTLHKNNGAGVAQKVNFGKGKTWYIAGEDEDGSLVLISDPYNPIHSEHRFNSTFQSKDYDTSYGTYLGTVPSKANGNHYGASDIRKYLATDALDFFTVNEKKLMNNTLIYTDDYYGGIYYTSDKLYLAYGIELNHYITVGKNSSTDLTKGIKVGINNTEVQSDSPYTTGPDFYLRSPSFEYEGVYALIAHEIVWDGVAGVANLRRVVPAFNMNLSEVLFASTAPSAPSDDAAPDTSLSDAMTFRMNGKNVIKSKAKVYYDKIEVSRGTADKEYIYIQYNDGTQDQLVVAAITESVDLYSGNYGLDSFENCKIWIEKYDKASNLTYAVNAEYVYCIVKNNMIFVIDATEATFVDFVKNYYKSATEVEAIIPSYVFDDTYRYAVTKIADDAFYGRKKLKNVYIPDTVTKMGTVNGCFANCINLVSIRLSDNINKFNDGAFYKCSSLTSFIIPETWDEIPRLMFAGTTSLSEITIPTSIKKIGENAFLSAGVSEGLTINYGGSKEEWKTLISDDNCAIGNDVLKAENVKINFAHLHSLEQSATDKSKHICTTCDLIQDHDFTNNGTCDCGIMQVVCEIIEGTQTVKITGPNREVDMTGDLIIPSTVKIAGEDYTVTEIADNAFRMCKDFSGTLTIPNSVISIGKYAFQGCSSFTGSLTIPNSVTTIGDGAFLVDCFTGDLVIPDSVTEIGTSAFEGNKFNGTLTISNSITTIKSYTFANCKFTGTLIIPDSVTTIESSAFRTCDFTGDLNIPDSVTSIGNSAFLYCRYLNTVSIPCGMDISISDTWGVDAEKLVQRDHIFAISSDNTSKHICSVCYLENEHDFSESSYYPIEDKTKHYQKCKDCGATSTPVAHTETEIKNKKDATCTEKGYTGDTCCKACGAVIEAGKDIEASGHSWDEGKVTKEPTKDADGVKTFTCTKCGETKTETIDKLPDNIDPTPGPSPDPDKPTPTPNPEPVKPLVPEISVKGKFDVAAAVATVSDKKPLAYAITSSDKKVGKITKAGILTAKKAGEVEITAYSDKKKTEEITKVKVVIKSTKVPVKDTIRYMDETYDLKSKITDMPLGVDVKFSISEKQQKFATVDVKTGIITPVKNGKVKVTVEIGEGKNAAKFYTTVTIKTPQINPAKAVVIAKDKAKAISLKNVKSSDKIEWSVLDTTKAEIIKGSKDSKIKVKGLEAGKAILTADVNGHKINKEIEITE